MILILSEEDDQSTSKVMDWLRHNGNEVLRINRADLIGHVNVHISAERVSISFKIGEQTILLEEIKAYWYRRGRIRIEKRDLKGLPENHFFQEDFEKVRKLELKSLEDLVMHRLDGLRSVNSYFTGRIEKQEILLLAQQKGLMIPATLITSDKKELLEFKHQHGRIITKAIREIFSLLDPDKGALLSYTGLVDDKMIQTLPETFFPSLFQECLDKKYELRIFYLNGKCKTMAIFSQQDTQTEIDFREYNLEFPNRTVPFELPEKIAQRIQQMMEAIPLNCGSIDMVVTKENDFVFLEVNPVGQFGMTSFPCNYYLEKDIAEFLSNPVS